MSAASLRRAPVGERTSRRLDLCHRPVACVKGRCEPPLRSGSRWGCAPPLTHGEAATGLRPAIRWSSLPLRGRHRIVKGTAETGRFR